MADRLRAKAPLVVVLGGGGFLGSAVVRELAGRAVRVRVVSRTPTPLPHGGPAEVTGWLADLTEPGETARAVRGADAVLHLAARFAGAASAAGGGGSANWRVAAGDEAAEAVNVGVMRDVVRALEGRTGPGPLPVVLFTGSTSQAGVTARVRIDGSEPDDPVGVYARQKLAAERLLTDASARGVLRGAGLRLTTVFGHGPHSTVADRGVVSAMARRALAGQPLSLWHDGTVLRDLLYVDDAARAVVAALGRPAELAGRHWLVGTGRGVPLGEVFRDLSGAVARRTGAPAVPVVPVAPPHQSEATDFRSVEVDSTAFRAVTGWAPRVGLREALERTVAALAGPVRRAPADQPLSTSP
ncbi:NAD-dependent epimerase/dehydratase family protein [Streptomyces sp. NPDC051561]|uniref:NAD-dependent epimerase/dehydratase family protein n=1 Tax=Streptomyces sp. NPDC051561 TaxID=3365658 RepID=UPI0037963140